MQIGTSRGRGRIIERGPQLSPRASSYRILLRASLIAAVLATFLGGCAMEPQSHPLNTGPIPPNARVLDSCSTAGQLACGGWSVLSGAQAEERRSACVAYIEPSGRRVEMCGSLPASQP
jgi:hypothetical protein